MKIMRKNLWWVGAVFAAIVICGATAFADGDILINDDITGHSNLQCSSQIARNSSGNGVIVWTDSRSTLWQVYGQRINPDGNAVGSIFRIGEAIASSDNPAVAINESGEFVVVWVQVLLGQEPTLRARSFNPYGEPQYASIPIDELNFAYNADIVIDEDGRYAICWSNLGIYLQMFEADGSPRSAIIQVSHPTEASPRSDPQMAVGSDGKVLVAWTDERNKNTSLGAMDIYAQLISPIGDLEGTNFRVNDDNRDAAQHSPCMATTKNGGFILAWEEAGSAEYGLYATILNSDGSISVSSFKVNNEYGENISNAPASISVNGSGDIYIAWPYNAFPVGGVFLQKISQTGELEGANVKAVDWTNWPDYVSIAAQYAGNVLLCWTNMGQYQKDVYIINLDESGSPAGEMRLVADDSGFSDQTLPRISTLNDGNFIVAWQDERDPGNGSIGYQAFDNLGNPISNNILTTPGCGEPIIIGGDADSFLTVWEYSTDVYGQWRNITGDSLRARFIINDVHVSTSIQWRNPAGALNANGRSLITWVDAREGIFHNRIYAQFYDNTGQPIGSNFPIGSESVSSISTSVICDCDNNFVIAWEDQSYILLRRFNEDGGPLSDAIQIGDIGAYSPYMAAMPNGNIVIVWTEVATKGGNNIYLQIFDSQNNAVISPKWLNNTSGTQREYRPHVCVTESGYIMVVWQSLSENPLSLYDHTVIGQVLDAEGNLIRANIPIGNVEQPGVWQMYPEVAATGNSVMVIWQDNRRAMGWDIYGHYFESIPSDITSVDESDIVTLPSSFRLGQNYPNPFNPTTQVEFSLPEACHVKLDIYNITGQKVLSLIDNNLDAGVHIIQWDGKDTNGRPVATGIYFYRLQAGEFINSKKMLLLK